MTTTVQNHPVVFTSPSSYQNGGNDTSFQSEIRTNLNGSTLNDENQSYQEFYNDKKIIATDSHGVGKDYTNDDISKYQNKTSESEMSSYSIFSNLPLPESVLSNNLQRGIHVNSQWTLESLQELKEEFMKLYEVAKIKQKQWKSDLNELDNGDKDNFQQNKRRKLNDSPEASSWKFVNQVKRCGFVNANGVQCKRAGSCPFHGEGAEYIRGVLRKKHDRDIDLLVLAASTIERNELNSKSTPKKNITINSRRLSNRKESPVSNDENEHEASAAQD